MSCEHVRFDADVIILNFERDGAKQFIAEIAVRCGACGVDFKFKNLPDRILEADATRIPHVTGNHQRARMPIYPADFTLKETL